MRRWSSQGCKLRDGITPSFTTTVTSLLPSLSSGASISVNLDVDVSGIANGRLGHAHSLMDPYRYRYGSGRSRRGHVCNSNGANLLQTLTSEGRNKAAAMVLVETVVDGKVALLAHPSVGTVWCGAVRYGVVWCVVLNVGECWVYAIYMSVYKCLAVQSVLI